MFTYVVIPVFVALLILEFFVSPRRIAYLNYSSKLKQVMAEPGEKITHVATVHNNSILPMAFVQTRVYLPKGARLVSEGGQKEDLEYEARWNKAKNWSVLSSNFTIMGRKTAEVENDFAMNKRGVFSFGDFEIFLGSLLGISEMSYSGKDTVKVVIIPERCQDQKIKEVLGGFIGDISVRRFIQDDPILTVGFSDYTGREPFKDISWTRSAVQNDLVVKKYDHTSDINVVILLNVEGGREDDLEECFRIARSAAEELEKKKIPFEFRTNGLLQGPMGGYHYMPKGLGESHLRALLYGLGAMPYTCIHRFATMLYYAEMDRKQEENYLLITPPLDEMDTKRLRDFEAKTQKQICVLVGEEGQNGTGNIL